MARQNSSVRPLLLLAAGFVLLLLGAAAALFFAAREQAVFADVQNIMKSTNSLDHIQTLITDAETGQRGYLLTGREEYLLPFKLAREQIAPAIDTLIGQLPAAGPSQTNVATLRQLSESKLSELQQTIDLRTSGRLSEALAIVNNDTGSQLMNQIREVVAKMRDDGRQFLEQREAGFQNTGRAAELVLAVSIFLVVVLAILAFRDTSGRIRKLEAANQQLQHEMNVRHAAETQVRQLQKMEAIGQLTGGIAHDFNNMLAVIMGSLELAQRKLPAGEAADTLKYLNSATEGAKRAAALTSRLLAFSRQQALEPKPLDLNGCVNSMSELIRRTIGESIHVETVLAGGLWNVFADPAQVENALINLAVNSRDAMPEGGRLTIETANMELDDRYARDNDGVIPGQYVGIYLTDTGAGMPPEILERAFDPFYTTKAPGKGTGLGLSQVFGFVKQSGGHIKLYSELHHGTTVKIYLPRYRGEDRRRELRQAPLSLPLGRPEETVLVVEDDAAVGRIAADHLQELGYSVVLALSPGQALARIRSDPDIALLFTDIVMPEMNGRELADKARACRPDIRVLYTTGYTRNATIHNGTLDPGASLLTKPFSIEQLALKVREILDR